MVGETVSHYRILEELGGGAMGVVYKAQDLRLKRLVALKFLPPVLTRDVDAKDRFVQEAESASALDDPHVCTVYDIDETADGRVFIAMGFYDGETLKKRIQRGPLSIEDVATIGAQIARGLSAAHEAGIVHRDIKPANVMLTSKGEVKIVDFGIAKLAGQSDLTRTGLSLGTVSYMAPEQFIGQVDRRADIWSLGVVLYEMLTRRRPFEGENDMTVMRAVVDRTPPPVKVLRPDVPDAMVAIIERALQKDPSHRFESATEMADALEATIRPAAPAAIRIDDTSATLRTIRRPVVAVPALAVIGVVTYVMIASAVAQARARWAREEAVPEVTRLLQGDDYQRALDLARQADRYLPHDPVLAGLLTRASAPPPFSSVKPDGARVYAKPYADAKGEWRLIGTAPLAGTTHLARGAYRWRIEADGLQTVELARNVGDPSTPPEAIQLVKPGVVQNGMVAIPATRGSVNITGFMSEDAVALAPFSIDRHEVTNAEFKAFVQAGGYTKREYWKHDITQDDRPLPWEQAMTLFRDSSGRPGPATWEIGDYPAGQADYPVGGVSWYEAAAYAEFRGASLPTIYHWARAALTYTNGAPIRGLIVDASNYGGKGPVPVESSGAIGPYGTYDMAGNVREWCVNPLVTGNNRWILGGAWNDYSYMSVTPYSLPPLDRSPMNGFRLVKYAADERLAELSKPLNVFRRDFRNAKPVSDEVFQVFKRQFAYAPSPPNAKLERTDAPSPDWVREKVTLDAGYGERLTAYVFVPKNGPPRHQALVFFPGLGQFLANVSSDRIAATDYGQDYLLKSGRILVAPVWKGSYERFDGFVTLQGDRYLQTFRQRMFQWRQEMGQLLDYLASRPDIDADKLAYTGASFGASVALPLLAIEPRLKTAVLLLAGFTYRDLLPENEAVNYAPRITMPVLMLEARYDHLFPVELSQQPLMALLGSPADQKRQVLFDAGHGALPRGQVISEGLAWLDRYLGPVQ
jgi:formylglycine-generating enzyme required for sulfatase activity/dienelactone hydrolase